MGSPAQTRSRAAQSMFSPLSVTREREKTDEGEAQTETEAPERPQSLISSLLRVTGDRERKEGARASQRSPGGQTTRRDSGEVPEKEPWSRLRQRRDRSRRKLRRGPGVGWD